MEHSQVPSVLLIGAGRMGSALVGCWFGDLATLPSLAVIEPHAERRDALERTYPGIDVHSSIADSEAGKAWKPDVIVIAVKPQDVLAVLKDCAHLVNDDTVLVSLAAGYRISKMELVLGQSTSVVRAMPNIAARVGKGMTGCVGNAALTQRQAMKVEALLRHAGEVCWLDNESQMNAVTAISGSGPAYVCQFVDAFARAATQFGIDETLAVRLVSTTVVGAAALLERYDSDTATLCSAITSPGGTTEAGLRALKADDSLERLLYLTLLAAWARSIELADEHDGTEA